MAYEHDEIRKRQLQRRQEHKRQQELKRIRNKKRAIIALSAASVLVLGALVTALVRHISKPKPEDATPVITAPQDPGEAETVIHLAFGGDVNATDKVVANSNWTELFMDVAPLFAGADSAAVNFEGNLCGGPYGTEGTRAPQELAQALSAAGVDLMQIANSCTINNGLQGLSQTVESIRQAGMEPVGAYASVEEAEKYKGFTLRSICGVKVAFVAFTKGMGNLSLPQGSEDRVNLLYTDYTSTYQEIDREGIQEILRAVALEKPDITVALLHWGSEHNNQVSESQKQIVSLMQKEGVDAIIGTHSHYVQKIEYDEAKGTVVAYSLGDLLGDGEKDGTAYSIVLQLEITKNNQSGEAKITAMDYTPVYIVTEETESGSIQRLLRIEPAMAAYEANSIHKVSQELYLAMKSALSRIRSRVSES